MAKTILQETVNGRKEKENKIETGGKKTSRSEHDGIWRFCQSKSSRKQVRVTKTP